MNAPAAAMTAGSRTAGLDAVLARFADPDADPVALLRALIDVIRPRRADDESTAAANWRALNTALAGSETHRRAVSRRLIELFATRRLVTFFTEAGILPNAGFFSELWRKLVHKLLPEIPDERSLKDCVDLVFRDAHDHRWLDAVPMADKLDFWRLVDLGRTDRGEAMTAVLDQLLESMLILSHRTAGLGLEPELRRVCPDVEERASPFLALHYELRRFIDRYRESLVDASRQPEDERHVLVLLDQCREVLRRGYRAAATRGTTLTLTYLLKRLEQHLQRIELLTRMLGARFKEEGRETAIEHWALFMRAAVQGENQRNSIRRHFSELIGLLALRVTENASRTGEHYITSDWPGYRAMWRSAMGAGLIIAILALFKILASRLDLAPFSHAALYSLNYGLGFVLVALLHFTIATKQPAMTAATLAAALSQTRGKLADIERLVNLIVDTVRSQIAAILGNVLLAMVTASLIAWALSHHGGVPLIDAPKVEHLLHELRPFRSLALLHAAIAGLWLFVAGLVSGYFDNQAAYARVGERVARLRWLQSIAGEQRARRLGAFVHDNLGTIAGNFIFGCLLGSTGTIGYILGLPLDIRHVAFASANLAYAVAALDYQMPLDTLLESAAGVVLIAFVNLTVSFTLALWVALRSRDATFAAASALPSRLVARLLHEPGSFLVPQRAEASTGRP